MSEVSDIDGGIRYAEPAEDRSAREGSIGLLVLLAVGLAIAAVALAMVSREAAEPFVLAILAGLSVVGVFSLFAGAVGILHFGERAGGGEIAQAFADNLPEGVMITTADGKILYANDAYRHLTGADGEGSVTTIERAFAGHPEIAEQIFRLVRAARQQRPWSEEIRLPGEAVPLQERGEADPLGARWFRISVRQIPAGRGSRAALNVWQLAETTGERRAEEATFDKLQQIIDYLDRAPAGFLSVDREGRIEYVNATLAEWLDLDLSEAASGQLKLDDLFAGEAAALVTGGAEAGRAQDMRSFDIDLARRDATRLPVRVFLKASGTRNGEKDRLSHMLILDRSRGAVEEGDARAAAVRFSRFFHSAPIAIATVDADGQICSTNAAFLRMFSGLGDRVAEGETPLASLISSDVREAIETAIARASAGQTRIDPVDIVFGDNNERSGRFYLSPVERGEEGRETAIVYAIDTTEQRALEMQIAQSQKVQAVGQLAGGIAHDFNNVLTAIIGFSELLLASHRPTDPAFQDIMNIKNNANRAAGMVRQLLAFSRQQTLRPQILSLTDVLSELKILLDHLLGETIELTVEHGRDLWPVKVDLHQFEQVIINLAVNARDAMPEGGKLTIRTANMSERESERLSFPGLQPGDYVVCSVSDTGHGIPADVIDKIFDPFFTTKEVGKGTGLGLSTVIGIIKQSGGYIYPESELGKGTTFHIFLPRQIVESEVAAEGAGAASEAADAAGKRDLTGSATVLLVEDEEAVRSFAVRALESRGYTVLEATTGVEALEVMDKHGGEVDLVVSDVVMPEMDGPTLLQHLRKRKSDVKIIFVSGYAEDAFKKNLEGEEEFGFLPKPFSLKQLAETVKQTLEE